MPESLEEKLHEWIYKLIVKTTARYCEHCNKYEMALLGDISTKNNSYCMERSKKTEPKSFYEKRFNKTR